MATFSPTDTMKLDPKTIWFFNQLSLVDKICCEHFRPLNTVDDQILTELLAHCGSSEFEPINRPVYKWYDTKRMHLWSEIRIYRSIDYHPSIRHVTQIHQQDHRAEKIDWRWPKELFDNILPFGCSWQQITIKKLDPGGYIRPHRDLLTEIQSEDRYNHVWMPINDVHNAWLGIWPHGKYAVPKGKIYHFDHHLLWHAIINLGCEPRYTLVGTYESTGYK